MKKSDSNPSPEMTENPQAPRMFALLIGLTCLAFFAVLLASFAWHDSLLSLIASVGILLQAIPFLLLRSGHVRASSTLFMVLTLCTIGIVAATGQGLRDTAIVAIPVVLFFSGLTLSRRQMVLGFILSVSLIAALAFGESLGWYTSQPVTGTPSLIDFGIVLAILMAAAAAAEVMARSFRRNISEAQQELERRRASEEALARSEKIFRDTFESAPIGIYSTSEEGKILMANATLARIMGYGSAPELMEAVNQKNIKEVLYSRPGERAGIIGQALRTAGWSIQEIEFKKNGGGVILARVYVRAVRRADGSLDRFEGMLEDITENRRLELAQRESETKFRAAFMTGADAYVIVEQDSGLLMEVNDRFLELFGYERAEVIGRTSLELGMWVNPEARQELLAKIRQQGFVRNYEVLARRKNGESFWVLYSTSNLQSEGKQLMLGVDRDITEQKANEKKIAEALKLEELLADIAAQFVHAPMGELRDVMKRAQMAVCDLLSFDVSTIWERVAGEGISLRESFQYSARDLPPLPGPFLATEYFPWCEGQIAEGKIVQASSMRDLPAEAVRDRASWENFGIKSSLILPLVIGEHVYGALSFGVMGEEKPWPPDTVNRLKLVADLFASAFSRAQSEKSLRESEGRYRSIFEQSSMPMNITESGVITYANPAYLKLFGYESADEINQKVGLDMFAPESRERVREYIMRRAQGLPTPPSYEAEVFKADGSRIPITVHITRVEFADGPGSVAFITDDTARKHAEELLKESETKFRELVQGANSAIVRWSATGEITFFNKYGLDFFGYKEEEILGRPVSILVPQTESTGVDLSRLIEDIRKQPEHYLYNVNENIRRDGSRVWMSWTNRPVYDAQGKLVELLSIANDITPQKETEEALKKSEERFRSLFQDNSAAMMLINQKDGQIVEVNPAAIEFYGWPREQFLRLKIQDINTLTPAEVEAAMQLTQSKHQNRFEFKHRLADGSVRDVEVFSSPVMVGTQGFLHSIIHDISQQKRVQSKLTESEERFRTVFMLGPDALYLATLDGGLILEANENFEKLFGYCRPEFMHKTSKELNMWADYAQRARMLEDLRNTGSASLEIKIRRKTGDLLDCVISTRVFEMEGKKYIVGALRDMTKQKEMQAEQEKLRTKAEMSARLAAIGEMAAGIAHEINNPLTGVIGFSELLMDEKALPERIQDQLHVIYDGSRRVKDIVKRMLTFARQDQMEKTSSDLQELIDNTLELRSYVLRTSNIDVVKHYQPGLPRVMVDPGRIQQVFLNLIVNAEQAMKKAHGRGVLTITTTQSQGGIHISFLDDGPGISDENKPRLFEPFFTTKAPGEGTGLGLSMSHTIIQEHSGSLTVESEVGHGANFVVELPLSTPGSQSAPSTERGTQTVIRAERSGRLLVVDDEVMVRSWLTAFLGREGHLVEECESGVQALEKVERGEYDIIFMDIRMPGMSGVELYDRIVRKWPAKANRIVFITGESSDPLTREYRKIYKIPFLSKPLEQETVRLLVNSFLPP